MPSLPTSSLPPAVNSAVAVLISLGIGLGLVVVLAIGGMKLVMVAVAAMAMLVVVMAAQNARLLFLALLVFSLPLALSKQFGEIVYKGGGEQAFRLEVFDLFVIVLASFQFLDIYRHRVPGFRIPKIFWLWIAIIVMGVVDVAQGPWRTSSAHEVVRMTKMGLLLLVLVNEIKTPEHLKACLVPLALGLMLQGAVGFVQYLKGDLIGLEFLGETTAKTIQNLAYTSVVGSLAFRPSALLLHANVFGIYVACVLPILIGAMFILSNNLSRLLVLASMALGLVGLILSQSRSAWVSFALAYAVLVSLMVSHKKLNSRAVTLAIVSAIGLFILLLPFADTIFTRLFESRDDATVGRMVFLEDFFRLIRDHWFSGVGINTYTREVVPYLSFSEKIYNGWIPPVHNIYLLWWGEMGIFGLLLHLAIWFAIIRMAWRNLRSGNEWIFLINAGVLASMVAFLFDGMLSFSLRVSQPLRMYMLMAAFVYASYYWRTSHERLPSRRRSVTVARIRSA